VTEKETRPTLLEEIRKDISTILNETKDIKNTNEDLKHKIERLQIKNWKLQDENVGCQNLRKPALTESVDRNLHGKPHLKIGKPRPIKQNPLIPKKTAKETLP
jgi:cell division septum initiation protein DivIVA